MQEPTNKDLTYYQTVLSIRAYNLQQKLPIIEDKEDSGVGQKMIQEIQRLCADWLNYSYSIDRRFGLDSEITIPSGTPVQTCIDFKYYITTGEIDGKIKKESTVVFDRRINKPIETTDTLFLVTVELPENPDHESFTNPRAVDIFVPNDRIKSIEKPAEEIVYKP